MSGGDKSSCGTAGTGPGRSTPSGSRRCRPVPRHPRRDRDPARRGRRDGRSGWTSQAQRSRRRCRWPLRSSLAAAAAERVVVQLGPRSWYTASTPVIVLAALIGGPLLGVAAGASTQIIRPESVWRRQAAEGGVAALQGLAAGIVGAGAAARDERRHDPGSGRRAWRSAIARQRRRPVPDHARAQPARSCSSSGRSASGSTCSRACSSSRSSPCS